MDGSSNKREVDRCDVQYGLSTVEPFTKRLRSSQHHVTIVLGGDDSGVRTKYVYDAAFLAHHSRFVDTALATDMSEKVSKSITFPDVDKNTWEAMIYCVADPVGCRVLGIEDALLLLPYYDKYDFVEGMKLCDAVLSGYIDAASGLFRDHFHPGYQDAALQFGCHFLPSLFCDAAASAHKYDLCASLGKAACFLKHYITSNLGGSTAMERYQRAECMLLFKEEEIEQVAPILAMVKEGDGSFRLLPNELGVGGGRDPETTDCITLKIFPDLFVRSWRLYMGRMYHLCEDGSTDDEDWAEHDDGEV